MSLPDDSRFGGERTCGQCIRHYETEEEDFVACGAGVEENPIWAIRKYSLIGMRDAIDAQGTGLYVGQDCERMRRDDGIDCPAFIRGKDIQDVPEQE